MYLEVTPTYVDVAHGCHVKGKTPPPSHLMPPPMRNIEDYKRIPYCEDQKNYHAGIMLKGRKY